MQQQQQQQEQRVPVARLPSHAQVAAVPGGPSQLPVPVSDAESGLKPAANVAAEDSAWASERIFEASSKALQRAVQAKAVPALQPPRDATIVVALPATGGPACAVTAWVAADSADAAALMIRACTARPDAPARVIFLRGCSTRVFSACESSGRIGLLIETSTLSQKKMGLLLLLDDAAGQVSGFAMSLLRAVADFNASPVHRLPPKKLQHELGHLASVLAAGPAAALAAYLGCKPNAWIVSDPTCP